MSDHKTITAFPDGAEFSKLQEAHPLLVSGLDQIAAGFTELFELIEKQESSMSSNILYMLIGASYREYEEVLILGLNAYGSGAMKLLRALYERTVTTQYLMLHPQKVQQFVDFTAVHWHKLLLEADVAGVDPDIPEETRRTVEDDLIVCEAEFSERICSKKTCEKTRLQGSWTKKPLPTQAGEVNELLRKLCFHGYLMPTFFLHTTFWGIKQQTTEHDNGKLELHNRENELEHAARSVVIACNLMGHLAYAVDEYYKLNSQTLCDKIMKGVDQIGKELFSAIGKVPQQERQAS